MLVYVLTQADLDRLLLMVDRNPVHGFNGGSCQDQVYDKENLQAHKDAHRFYNYQVRTWIDQIKQ